MAVTSIAGARERLLRAADRLFYARGIRAVGINEIVHEAGVAKTSLYLHFVSKDELVTAYLEGRVADYVQSWNGVLRATSGQDPDRRIDAVFDGLRLFVESPGFRGCPFVNAAAELPDAGHPGHVPIRAYRRYVQHELFGEVARAAGLPAPEDVAAQLQVLYDGALAGAMIENGPVPVERARAVAHRILAGDDRVVGSSR